MKQTVIDIARKAGTHLFLFFVTYLIYVYPIDAMNYLFFEGRFFRLSSLFVSFPVYFAVIFYFRTHTTFAPLTLFAHEGMGVGFISFWVSSFALICHSAFDVEAPYIGVLSFVVIGFLVLYSVLNGRSIVVKKIEIRSPKVSENVSLAFVSDVHLGSNSGRYLETISEKIKSLNCDLLIIGGDFIDSSSFDLAELKSLELFDMPILFISGNHEYYLKDYAEKLRALENYNLKFLDNDAFRFKEVNIIGVSDNQALTSQEKVLGRFIEDSFFNLAVIHKPSLWERVVDKVDLMLSGHTHNGQIFPFGLFVRIQFKQVYGLYERLNSALYVSSGAGCWGPRMRLGTKNEIVKISISAN